MKILYGNSDLVRPDRNFKTFMEHVIIALGKLDKTLESIDKYKLKKVRKADSKNDEAVIFWLDPIPDNTVTSSNEVNKQTYIRIIIFYVFILFILFIVIFSLKVTILK